MMADKQMTYYLSEFTAPSMGVAIVNPNDVSPFVQSKFAELKLDSWQGGPTAPVGNNDAVLANNVQSDVIKAQNAIDHFIDDWAKNKKATIESRVGTNLYGGRFNGVEVTGHLANEKDQFRVRCFCDYPSKSIVLIGVAGNAKRVGATSASKFLNSLEMWQ